MNLTDSVSALLADLRLRNYKSATLKHYTDQLKRFQEWLPDDLAEDLRRITKDDIDSYHRYVREERISTETKGLRMRAVKRLFDHLTANGDLLIHPAEHIVEIRRKERLPKSILTVKQVEQLIAAADTTTPLGLRDRALMEVLYGTAIRVGELEEVLIADVDLTKQTLFVREGKGGKDRTVPLGATAGEWVKRYLDEARPLLARKRQFERKLFVVMGGRPLLQTQTREILKKYKRQSNLRKSVSPHMLRHACATHLLQVGADIRLIQELLGHSNLESTTIYTRVAPLDVKAMHRKYHPGEIGNPPVSGDADH